MGCSASFAFQKEVINIMKQHADGFASSSKSPPKETCEMSSQEFIARINALIPSPNEEANKNLLDFGNSLWLRLKEDLYNAFSFISRHFGRFNPLELLYNATACSVIQRRYDNGGYPTVRLQYGNTPSKGNCCHS